MPPRKLLTTSELAAELGLSIRTIHRYTAAKDITPTLITPGNHYRWDPAEVRQHLRELAERRRIERDRADDSTEGQ